VFNQPLKKTTGTNDKLMEFIVQILIRLPECRTCSTAFTYSAISRHVLGLAKTILSLSHSWKQSGFCSLVSILDVLSTGPRYVS
jgi:hypothetical protein